MTKDGKETESFTIGKGERSSRLSWNGWTGRDARMASWTTRLLLSALMMIPLRWDWIAVFLYSPPLALAGVALTTRLSLLLALVFAGVRQEKVLALGAAAFAEAGAQDFPWCCFLLGLG